jgi:hypothetical protein
MKSIRAPKKDRIKGSLTNKPLSASNKSNKIVFSERLTNSIKAIIKNTNTSLSTAKAVVRRGFGAYSTSHRPNVTRTAWGLARLKLFVKKNSGVKVNPKYIQDDDLLN